MLELTTFQIFFMVLHGAVLVFLIAFLTRGTSQRSDKVVYLNEVKRKRRRKKKVSPVAKSARVYSHQPQEKPTREIREVREVRDLLEANRSSQVTRYSLASPQRKSS